MYSDQAMECRITECRMSLFYPGVAIGVARYFFKSRSDRWTTEKVNLTDHSTFSGVITAIINERGKCLVVYFACRKIVNHA